MALTRYGNEGFGKEVFQLRFARRVLKEIVGNKVPEGLVSTRHVKGETIAPDPIVSQPAIAPLARLALVDKIDLIPHEEHIDDPNFARAICTGSVFVQKSNQLFCVKELLCNV